ncbi:MAG: chorismate mutase [Bacteroidales bacterium]|nr:chorismate mutase [Bacteroidales bacterium]
MKLNLSKLKAEECRSIEDIRRQIDIIDKEIIKLISKRASFVKEVVKFKKPDKESIAAKDRYKVVVEERKKWAKELGFNEEVIQKIYQTMLDYFIEMQLKQVNIKTKQKPQKCTEKKQK